MQKDDQQTTRQTNKHLKADKHTYIHAAIMFFFINEAFNRIILEDINISLMV